MQDSGLRIRIAATVGNTLEWFDFAVYGYFARDIGEAFFPKGDAAVHLVEAFAVFALGYLMRPLGAFVLGPVGDLVGRKTMLITSVMVMAIASLLIGLLPPHASWGIWSAYALLLLRMAQGFSVGGEYTGSITYLVESSPSQRRGLHASFTGAGAIAGFVLGALSAALVNQSLPPSAVAAWGWRIPFLLGAGLGGLAIWLREGIPEAFHPVAAVPLLTHLKAVVQQWRAILRVMAIIALVDVSFYLLFVYLVQYAISQQPQHAALYSAITTINEAIGVPIIVLGGWLADRRGALATMRRWNWTLVVVVIPAMLLMQQATTFGVAAGQLIALIPVMLILGCYPALLPGLFGNTTRCTGFSIGYSLTVALLGGTAPLVAAWLLGEMHWSWGPGLYAALWAIPSLWALKGLSNHWQST